MFKHPDPETEKGVYLEVPGVPPPTSCKIGDKVPYPDGVYIGYEGTVVIFNGTYLAYFTHVTDKWGRPINETDLLDERNPTGRRFKLL